MTRVCAANMKPELWPRLWRFCVVALGTLILCSCRSTSLPPQSGIGAGTPTSSLPPMAFAGPHNNPFQPSPMVFQGPEGMEQGIPLPYMATSPWAPPGAKQPWPHDEYLSDGGDEGAPVKVSPEWEIHGLEIKDTVAHYDALDGRTLVEPSNRVHIYSPRFGSVRQIVGVVQNKQFDRFSNVRQPVKLAGHVNDQTARLGTQNLQTLRQIGTKLASSYRSRQGNGAMSHAVGPLGFQDTFLPFENLTVIQTGTLEESETARLAEGTTAAIAWNHKQAVQVTLDNISANAGTHVDQLQQVFTVKTPKGHPKLRLVKVASTQFADPGDTIDFTLRFDNVGDQVIGNITIVDNLTTRLEYVRDSAQCSLPAEFMFEPNNAGSLVLRCELTDPLPVGKGGVVRFKCRVR